MTEIVDDDALVMRLRDLALVDVDALLAGVTGEAYFTLLAAHAEDLEDALRAARTRAAELVKAITVGDPLVMIDAGAAARARDGGREAAERVTRRLAARAQAGRALARLDDLAAGLYPRLVDVDRRRG